MNAPLITLNSAPAQPTAKEKKIVGFAVVSAALWIILIASATYYHTEPVTGGGCNVFLGITAVNLLLMFFLGRALRRGLYGRAISFAGCLLILAIAIPINSKGGLEISVNNQMSTTAHIQINRADATTRNARLTVLPGTVTRYRTAPGDYSEDLKVEFASGEQKLSATINQLRKRQVVLTESGIALVEMGEGPR